MKSVCLLLVVLLIAGCSSPPKESYLSNESAIQPEVGYPDHPKKVGSIYSEPLVGSEYPIPQEAIHWHPKLKIIIKGEEQEIPVNIGIAIGQNIDNEISGMRMSPIHTHEDDGTIHMENDKPYAKPETLTLGYLFKVWGKKFNSTCIFEYCNGPTGNVKMLVNGKENDRFDLYYMKDRDQIEIMYE